MDDDTADRALKGRAALEEIDRRLGGVLGPLAEGLAKLVDAAEAAQSRGGGSGADETPHEATVQTARGPLRVRTGLSVRMGGLAGGAAAAPHAAGRDPARPVTPAAAPQPRGPRSGPTPAATEASTPPEPPHDLFVTADAFALSADLPGAEAATLTWELRDAMLTLQTPPPRPRRLTVACPDWLRAEDLRLSLVNGVLEMTAERRS